MDGLELVFLKIKKSSPFRETGDLIFSISDGLRSNENPANMGSRKICHGVHIPRDRNFNLTFLSLRVQFLMFVVLSHNLDIRKVFDYIQKH